MEKFDIYNDISTRTGGDLYIGIVGPVRTGKSTFVRKFMENFVIPNINNKLSKQIATDELPQSADGKTVMTTQPMFVPANGVKVQFKNKASANIRLIDCVGFVVDGALGQNEGEKPRLVKTPWDKEEIPFNKAAEIGTRKVISEYSSIGIMITTDGSFTGIDRGSYIDAEEKTVNELKDCGKPFIILLNCAEPDSENAINLANGLEEKYLVPVMSINATKLNVEDINNLMEKVLMEFPMNGFNVNIPKWMRALPQGDELIQSIIEKIKNSSDNMTKMKDFSVITEEFSKDERINGISLCDFNLGNGYADYELSVDENLFYDVLTSECGEKISDNFELLSYIKEFSNEKKKYFKIKNALNSAENDGYGIVYPCIDEMNLCEPELFKRGGRYGVKLKASAPTLHIMKVDVNTEVSPIVGTEKQGEDLVNYVKTAFEENPSKIWDMNMFGKPLNDLISDGLNDKINNMPKDTQNKMRKTISRIVNENRGGVICILL